MRNECLSLSNIAAKLGLEKSKLDQPQISTDLELRAKNRTIDKLKKQGEQYRRFNSEIPFLVEPELHKDEVVSKLREKATATTKLNKHAQESRLSVDSDT